MDTDDNLWCIKLPNGDVRSGTLEQLDEAFQAGHINEDTLVLGEGSSDWMRLGELLGLDEPPSSESIPVTQAPTKPPPQYAAPLSVAPSTIDRRASQPVPRLVPPVLPQTTESLSPMTTATDDGLPSEFRLGSRAKRAFAATFAVAAVLGAAGFVAVRTGRLHLPATSAPAAAAVPVYVAPPPEPVPPPAAAPEVAAPAPQDSAPARLTEQQRQQLQTVDKARELKSKVQKSTATPRPPTRTKTTGFTTGGSKFDPLNASF